MASLFPTIGEWYQDAVSNQVFEVVAVDEKGGTVEVQFADGAIDEYDMESWGQLTLMTAAAPEDANAGYGLPSFDDGWQTEVDSFAGNPLEFIEPESFGGFDDLDF